VISAAPSVAPRAFRYNAPFEEPVEKKSLVTSGLSDGPGRRALDLLSFAAVSAYLGGLLAFLIVSGRLSPSLSLRGVAATAMRGVRRRRPLKKRRLRTARPERGFCYSAPLPWGLESDQEGRSRLQLLEDGASLGPAHALHDTVRDHGRGAFSHWGGSLLFSSSDNSDPRKNGRIYQIAEEL